LECGGKRSATPLWIKDAFFLSKLRNTELIQSGVALRLPPHSKKK
jgi:hypothetical protein